jgi:hypothetical protein
MIQRLSLIVITLLLAVAGSTSLLAEAVGREVTISDSDNEKYLPAVAYNGDRQEFLVVWHNLSGTGVRDISAARLDRFGKVISTFIVASGVYSRAQPAVAYDDVRNRYLVVYIYDFAGDGSDWDVYGRLIPWSGPDNALTEFPIYWEVDSQWNPKVAYSHGDDEFLTVWGNSSAVANPSVSYRYVLANGTPDWAQTLAGDATHTYTNPDLAYNPLRDEYMVVYEIDAVDVAARRLDHTGILSSQVMVADWADTELSPAVAACPGQDQWLVVWQSNNPMAKPYARFLFGNGVVDGGPLQVYATTGRNQAPAVACLPGEAQYLIAWEEEYAGAHFGIGGRRLGTSKAFPAPGFVVRPVYGGQTRHARQPAVVGSTIGWSVAWVQEREGSTYSDVHNRMVWSLFADDLETGNTGLWSAASP